MLPSIPSKKTAIQHSARTGKTVRKVCGGDVKRVT